MSGGTEYPVKDDLCAHDFIIYFLLQHGLLLFQVEGIYLSAHRKIRADPSPLPKKDKTVSWEVLSSRFN